MSILIQDIKTQSDWIIKAFAADGFKLDYTIHSFIEIDKFFNKHSEDGKAKRNGRLSKNPGFIIFSIGSYVGETIIRNIHGAVWQTDDSASDGEITASILFPNGTTIFPIERVMKRLQNGPEDAVYVYGYALTKDYFAEPFDPAFWDIGSEENKKRANPWWKFW